MNPSPDRRPFLLRFSLSVLSGLMLGFSFPPSPFGVLACAGLVPLLIVLADVRTTRKALGYSYVAFVVFHLITLNWTGGYAHGHDAYMMIAGAVTIVLHPLFYFIPIYLYLIVRRNLGDWPALVALPLLWVSYEYSHTLSEWSFPWLTIGNSQTYNLPGIQYISITGVFGLSLWILVLNVLLFVLYSRLAREGRRQFSVSSAALALGILLVYAIPRVYGSFVLSEADTPRGERSGSNAGQITVGMIQPNLDPWDKWSVNGYQTVTSYLRMTDSLRQTACRAKPDLVLWPETAIPFFILTDANRMSLQDLRSRIDSIGVPVLTGFPHAVFYADSTQAPPSAKRSRMTGLRYDTFNAAALIQPGVDEIPWYGKMKMVPFAERVPYADMFHFGDFLRWDVGIGGWQIGKDSTVFVERRTGARFSTVICYESTYPAFVSDFVRKGAEFIAIITIDSWWAKMSGAYQHKQYAILRAVENRRWIARCAVGGISCFIDPYGRVYDETELLSGAVLCKTIGRSTELTPYTRYGDWLAQACCWLAGAFCAAALGQRFLTKNRERQWQST
jgi:apolipoprotein N-acyltransferase